MPRIKKLFVNEGEAAIDADPQQSLLEVLRDQAGLTGAKYGCGEGQCGACTVLVDGKPVRSCITPVEAAQGKPVTTIEGLAKDDGLHPLQEAFLQEDAFQCGYCTPGMILSASALLQQNAQPTRQEVVEFMNGNVCRCGTYPRILRAILRSAEPSTGGSQ
ncbi:MAG TPA: (2Fe-2S)-binding protein [Acidobacteriota bacterium]|nr:(2Fe-2S)-binding protein [Acidobacteriota bacterium]